MITLSSPKHQWEHQLFHWVDAYWVGLGSVEAQWQVKTFSSRQYKLHQQIPENVATLFDWCRCLQVVLHFYRATNLGHLKKKNSLNFWLNKNSSGHYFFPNIKIHRLHRGLRNLVFFQNNLFAQVRRWLSELLHHNRLTWIKVLWCFNPYVSSQWSMPTTGSNISRRGA